MQVSSEHYVSHVELEEWLEKRFGPENLFNRQLARDLLDWGVQAVYDRGKLDENPRDTAERLETRR